jgi:hypothetical protein
VRRFIGWSLPYRINTILSPISLSENLIFQLSLNPSPFGVIWGYDNGASLSIVKSQSAVAKIQVFIKIRLLSQLSIV